MKVIYAARGALSACIVALLVTLIYARTGLRIVGVLLPRQAWLVEHRAVWAASWWLWLLVVFAWMVLLTALMWHYLPGHRFNSMLQSGLMVIAATLTIGGILIWMNVLPWAAGQTMANEFVALADTLAFTLLGAGFFMVGAVTAWIAFVLMRLASLPVWLSLPGLLTGLAFLPTPLVLPNPLPIAVGLLFWLIWCTLLALRKSMPNAYPEWK